MKALNNISKAKMRLGLLEPFFATILMKYPLKACEDIPIAAVTPSGQILYNPKGTDKLSVDECVFVLCHEILHVVYMHALRRGDRDHYLYNIATDAVINETLIKLGVGRFIPGCARWPHAETKTSEQVYAEMLSTAQKMPSGQMDLVCSGDDSMSKEQKEKLSEDAGGDDPLEKVRKKYGKRLSESEKKMAETQAKMNVAEAVSMERMRNKHMGNAKGEFFRKLDEYIMARKLPWYEYLSKFMTGFVNQGESWRRPNRRFSEVYLPTTDRLPAMGKLVVGIDTSGSISNKELACFAKHLFDVIEDCRPESITVLWCDSEIAGVDEHSLDDSPFPLEPKGGGGTDMREITKWCVDNAPDADACVIFTDGYTPYPDEGEEEVPTLWVMTGEPYQVPDYITYVEFEVDQEK